MLKKVGRLKTVSIKTQDAECVRSFSNQIQGTMSVFNHELRSIGLIITFCAVTCCSTAFAETWTQWRGPSRNGVLANQDWPKQLSDHQFKSTWQIPLGPSYSSPLITEDFVVVTETRDKKTEVVSALDRETGKQVWSNQWDGAMSVPFFAASNGSWIRATPALDGDDLFVAGIRDVLVCLNTKTGAIKWKVDFVGKTGSALPSFGCVCSPLVDGDAVYIQAGGGFSKIDRADGRILWTAMKDGGGMGGSAFSSPVIATLCDYRQAVIQTRSMLAGVDLETGAVLWSVKVEAFRGMNILTPTVVDNRIFTSSYGGGSFLFEVSGDKGDGFKVSQVWRNKVQGYMSSPVVVDGHIYLHLRNQRFTCIDLSSGEESWITQPFGKYWSLVVANKQILALDERGELMLIRANPEKFDLIDQYKISDNPTWAHLALADGQVFIRELQSMHVLNWTKD